MTAPKKAAPRKTAAPTKKAAKRTAPKKTAKSPLVTTAEEMTSLIKSDFAGAKEKFEGRMVVIRDAYIVGANKDEDEFFVLPLAELTNLTGSDGKINLTDSDKVCMLYCVTGNDSRISGLEVRDRVTIYGIVTHVVSGKSDNGQMLYGYAIFVDEVGDVNGDLKKRLKSSKE